MKLVKKYLRDLRNQFDETQREMAKKLGISNSTLSIIESEDTVMQPYILKKIFEIYPMPIKSKITLLTYFFESSLKKIEKEKASIELKLKQYTDAQSEIINLNKIQRITKNRDIKKESVEKIIQNLEKM